MCKITILGNLSSPQLSNTNTLVTWSNLKSKFLEIMSVSLVQMHLLWSCKSLRNIMSLLDSACKNSLKVKVGKVSVLAIFRKN